MPHKQYFAGTLLGMSSRASYVSRTRDVIDDVTRSQSRSNFETDTSPSIFELECRSKHRKYPWLSWGPFWKFWNIKHSFNLTSDMKGSSQIMPLSQSGLKVGPLYSFINEIITFFKITKKRAQISLNFLCIDIRRLWLHSFKRVLMTSLMTSPCNKVGQILKLVHLR